MTKRPKSPQAWRWEVVNVFKDKHYRMGCQYNRNVSLGPIDPALLKRALDMGLPLQKAQGFAGIWYRPRIELVLAMPDHVKLVKAKAHPEPKDIDKLLECERLFPQTPKWEQHWHKPTRKFLIYAEENPEVIRQAHAQGITVYLFQEGSFIEL